MNPPPVEGLPDWIFWIATFLGTVIGAAIIRLGYTGHLSGNNSHKKSSVATGHSDPYIDKIGVLVDNKSIELLAGSIEGLGMEMLTGRKAMADRTDAQNRCVKQVVEELEELRRELRELSRNIREDSRRT